MPEYLAPGVYVEEVDTGSKPIEGVSTSTAGMVGMTKRGPTEGLPLLVTSFADFRRKFGGYLGTALGDNRFLAYAVEGFFQNGGKRVYIKRVSGKDTVSNPFAEAEKIVKDGMITTIAADTVFDKASIVSGPNDRTEKVRLATLRGISTGTVLTFTQIKEGVKTEEIATVDSYDSSKNEVTLVDGPGPNDTLLEEKYEKKYTYVTIELQSGSFISADTIKFKAKDPGTWGNDIEIQVKHTSMGKTTAASAAIPNSPTPGYATIELNSINNFYIGAVIEIDNETTWNRYYRTITDINGRVVTVEPSIIAVEAPTGAKISTCEFSLLVSYKNEQEVFDFLNMNSNTDNYFGKIINDKSLLITAADSSSTNEAPFNQPSPENGLTFSLEDGGDGDTPDPDAYVGVDGGAGNRTGIQALTDIDQVSIVAVPGITDNYVQNALINHCELLMDRFAILDPPPNSSLSGIQSHRSYYDTKYAAIYYPLITTRDPLTKTDIHIPPSGHLAGIYARSDIERGVHKAPANEVIRGITGLEQIINKGEQDILNPKPNHINVLRDFRSSGRGYRVWGARCITSDPDWKYINVRRLFIFIEESIEEGTQWVVFEPNDEPTWARVRRTVTNFLTNVWRDGALQGQKPEHAFFVKCDRTTMTQTDIDNGKLIMEIGIAPVKPAEFVIFRIGQWTGGSEVEEL